MSLRRIDFQLPHELIQIDRDVIDGIFERNGKQIVIVISEEKAKKLGKGTMTFLPKKEVE